MNAAMALSSARMHNDKAMVARVFNKIFSLDQIGSGQAMGEPLYF